MLVAKMTGYDAPVTVWPAEFRVAAMLEQAQEARDTASFVIPDQARSVAEPGSNREDCTSLLDPGSAACSLVRDDKKLVVGEGSDAHPERPG